MSLAFLFPGQGSQRVGMGADLKASRPDLFDRYFGAADEWSGLPLARLALEGSIEELTPTEVAQPAIYALSVALTHLARDAGIAPSLVAGHSLGEYSAVVAAGALEWEECLALVCLRGHLMAEAQLRQPGAMAAIGGLSSEEVDRLCSDAKEAGVVVIANFNSPVQSVVSGSETAVERVMESARSRGAEPALRLNVGAAFHSPLMESVRAPLAEALSTAAWREPRYPVASNVSGAMVTTAAELRDLLVEQVTSPVRWLQCMKSLVDAGADSFLELGPGRVLVGQARLIDHDLEAFAADGPKRLAGYLSVHPGIVRC